MEHHLSTSRQTLRREISHYRSRAVESQVPGYLPLAAAAGADDVRMFMRGLIRVVPPAYLASS